MSEPVEKRCGNCEWYENDLCYVDPPKHVIDQENYEYSMRPEVDPVDKACSRWQANAQQNMDQGVSISAQDNSHMLFSLQGDH